MPMQILHQMAQCGEVEPEENVGHREQQGELEPHSLLFAVPKRPSHQDEAHRGADNECCRVSRLIPDIQCLAEGERNNNKNDGTRPSRRNVPPV